MWNVLSCFKCNITLYLNFYVISICIIYYCIWLCLPPIWAYQHIWYWVAHIRGPYGANVYFVGIDYPTHDWHRIYVPPQNFRQWVVGSMSISTLAFGANGSYLVHHTMNNDHHGHRGYLTIAAAHIDCTYIFVKHLSPMFVPPFYICLFSGVFETARTSGSANIDKENWTVAGN